MIQQSSLEGKESLLTTGFKVETFACSVAIPNTGGCWEKKLPLQEQSLFWKSACLLGSEPERQTLTVADSLSLQGPGYSGKTGQQQRAFFCTSPCGFWFTYWLVAYNTTSLHSPLSTPCQFSQFCKFFKILALCDCYATRSVPSSGKTLGLDSCSFPLALGLSTNLEQITFAGDWKTLSCSGHLISFPFAFPFLSPAPKN